MKKHELILDEQEKPYLYVEYGAGRAGLSSFVANKLKSLGNFNNIFLLVDREARRYKLDKDFRDDF